MQRFFIITVNCVVLATAIIAVPEIAGVRFWRWEISSVAAAQSLLLWGLGIAAGGNTVAALVLLKGRKERRLCWLWAAVFSVLLGVEYAAVRGWLNFHWLQQALLWFQSKF